MDAIRIKEAIESDLNLIDRLCGGWTTSDTVRHAVRRVHERVIKLLDLPAPAPSSPVAWPDEPGVWSREGVLYFAAQTPTFDRAVTELFSDDGWHHQSERDLRGGGGWVKCSVTVPPLPAEEGT